MSKCKMLSSGFEDAKCVNNRKEFSEVCVLVVYQTDGRCAASSTVTCTVCEDVNCAHIQM